LAAAFLVVALLHDTVHRPAAAAEQRPDLSRLAVRLTPLVAHRVERIRGLRFRSLPRPRVISAARFEALNEREAGGSAKRRLDAGAVELKLLGLVDFGTDLSTLTGDASQLAAAAYDPHNGHLYVIRDAVPDNRALTEFVLAHELTHALEDQHFGLVEPEAAGDDRQLAALALDEGTATAVMTDYGRRYLDPLALAGSALGLDTSSHGVPPALIKQIEFAYFRGAAFVTDLYDEADGWNAVDIAIRSGGPLSTEQVIHPQKYLLGERPLPVAVGASPGPAWRRVDSGTIGEFATGQILELGTAPATAHNGAAGWGGDRYALWARRGSPLRCEEEATCRGSFALALAWRWDSGRDRRQFERALRDYVRVGLSGQSSGPGVWSLPGGWAAIGHRAGTVRLGLAPERRTADVLAGGRTEAGRR
jgi:hypothetical protein